MLLRLPTAPDKYDQPDQDRTRTMIEDAIRKATQDGRASGPIFTWGLNTVFSNTSDASLFSYTLPANTMGVVGDSLRITWLGTTSNVSAPTIHLRVGSTDVINYTPAQFGPWSFDIHLIIVPTLGSRASFTYAGSTAGQEFVTRLTVNENYATNLLIDFRGNAGAAGTITPTFALIEALPAVT